MSAQDALYEFNSKAPIGAQLSLFACGSLYWQWMAIEDERRGTLIWNRE